MFQQHIPPSSATLVSSSMITSTREIDKNNNIHIYSTETGYNTHSLTHTKPRLNSPVRGEDNSSSSCRDKLGCKRGRGGGGREEKEGGRGGEGRNAWNDGIQFLAGGESEAR